MVIRHVQCHPGGIALLGRLARIGVLVKLSVLAHDEEVCREDFLQLGYVGESIQALLKLQHLTEHVGKHLHLS